MMRRLNRRSIRSTGALALGLLLLAVPTTESEAGVFDPSQSFLEIRIGDLPPLLLPSTPLSCFEPECVFLVDNGFGGITLSETVSLWAYTTAAFPSSYFTGIPMVEGLRIQSLFNESAIFSSSFTTDANAVGQGLPATGFGAQGGFVGLTLTAGLVIDLTGGLTVVIPLTGVGSFATNLPITPVSPAVTDGSIAGMPWVTVPVQITGIESPIISMPGRKGSPVGVAFTLLPTENETVVPTGGTQNTITIAGSRDLFTASEAGFIRVVAPARIVTSGTLELALPMAIFKHYVFEAPEPTTMALFGAAIVTLLGLGRARMRR